MGPDVGKIIPLDFVSSISATYTDIVILKVQAFVHFYNLNFPH